MAERIILHCDLNNFFASVETLFYPEYKNVPMAVCGSVEERHGIVLAKNELAKAFGIVTAEPVWQAKNKCKELVIAPPHYDKYVEYSARAKEIYYKYTDMVEPFGIDECWLDVTNSTVLFGDGEKIANSIRNEIKEKLGLTISVGVSFNKIFAKLGSDMKKPDAVTILSKENFKEKIFGLKAEEILGVGKKTKQKLNSIGINTIGEIANAQPELFKRLFGKSGVELWQNVNGLNQSKVLRKDEIPTAKSYGRSITTKQDLINVSQASNVLLYLTEKIASSLRQDKKLATIVQISIRDTNLVTKEFSQRLEQPSRIIEALYGTGMKLLIKNWNFNNSIRSIGIRASEVVSENENVQYTLFYNTQNHDKKETLESKVFEIRNKFGNSSIVRASILELDVNDKKAPVFKNANNI